MMCSKNQAVVLPLSWRPQKSFEVIRVGPTEDGGYVIGAAGLAKARHLVSCGLFDDWRFEDDFHRRTGCTVDCYDPTVTSSFWIKRYLTYLRGIPSGRARFQDLKRFFEYRRFFGSSSERRHHRLFIGYPGEATTDLRSLLSSAPSDSAFVKIDIEGSEYRILSDIIAAQSSICGFVIEFHDVDLHLSRINYFIQDVSPWFSVAHIHVNNYAGYSPEGTPLAVEVTFARTSDATEPIQPETSYPRPELDFPCNSECPDPCVKFV